MATLNAQPFIATTNTLSIDKRNENIPSYRHAKLNNIEIPKEVDTFLDNLSDYIFSIVKFGFGKERKEDGLGERAYHMVDLETVLNSLRCVGFTKSYPEFMKYFPSSDGWIQPTMKMGSEVKTKEGSNKEIFDRKLYLGDQTFDELYEEMKNGSCLGLDAVDYKGIIHTNCKIIRINELHPDVIKPTSVVGENGEVSIENVTEYGVDSDLWLIITKDAQLNGWSKVDGEEELSLKGSKLIRTPLGFVALRRSRMEEPKTPWAKGTTLLQSMCPSNFSYQDFDKCLTDVTMAIQFPQIPGVIANSITLLNQQAFLNEEFNKAYMSNIDYILSPKEEKDGLAKLYKQWFKLTGQHQYYQPVMEVAQMIFKSKPRAINDRGDTVGANLTHAFGVVLDIEFNQYYAIIPQFEAVINPQGYRSGTSALTYANPEPFFIEIYNPQWETWTKVPSTKFILFDNRGIKYFEYGTDPKSVITKEMLDKPLVLKSNNELYRTIERTIKEQQENIENSKPA